MTPDLLPAGKRASSGFTLTEMLVGSLLASVVLLGLFNFTSTMLASQVNAERTSTVTAWSLAGISSMNADIAAAGGIGYPSSGASADELVVCTNWSMLTVPPSKELSTANTDAYYYCWDTADAAPYGNALLRKIVPNVASCPTTAFACTQANMNSGSTGADTVVATGVYRDTNNDAIFFHDNQTLNAVRLRYNVGNPAANAVSAGGNGGTITPNPVSVPYNTEIILEN